MRRAARTFWGLYELARLAVLTRFRFRGRYWRWRRETAFGRGWPEDAGLWTKARALIDYGAWAHEMRKSMRE